MFMFIFRAWMLLLLFCKGLCEAVTGTMLFCLTLHSVFLPYTTQVKIILIILTHFLFIAVIKLGSAA